ncbi:AmmeMemoRadiSam system protein B [Endozoicomonas sp. GU-1]|uniref:AmmeMemoRadiSam system protein B n=1 Tax=Endozoicomonas sp. GU-1 TaxID=3009078 RepID=UPI0022B2F9F5|nr:AmmeMemoRadiSam system protein B [Endozoicomonas sp. GU-1]WBA82811.1 AmmeMemoRadiSam system protein B [Endozoicomonas sp. GU-1]WBA85739.1 AmmeMemoRadiSam system protein B [Endozoicomonas sp. GU-1]
MIIRQPAVAGTFYPDSPKALANTVKEMLSDAHPRDFSPKVLVVPHAGFIYSGPVAASAYRLLNSMRQNIRRVALLGPSHRVPLLGMALPDCEAFATPLGNIPLDIEAMEELKQFSQVETIDEAHTHEHSLEVQCPFLQECLDDFKLIPIVVGDTSPIAVAEVIEHLWGEEETLMIISSDLSHYHTYEEACYRDNQTVKAIEQLSCNLTGGQACGCYPLNGMLKVAQHRGMDVITLDVRNSGDTAGDKSRVVGYGAFVIQ